MFIERGLNHIELEVDKKGVGVALFIRNKKGEVLVLEEKIQKRSVGREPGQISIPCETQERGEDIRDTYRRALKEELGVKFEDIGKVFKKESFFGAWPIMPGALAHIFIVDCIQTEMFNRQNGRGNEEVEILGWMKIEDLRTSPRLRPGIDKMIDFLAIGKI